MTGEGMSRLLGFLIEGAAESGRVRFHVCVRPVNLSSARALLQGLRAREGEDWTLNAVEVETAANPTIAPDSDLLLRMPDHYVGRLLFVAGLLGMPLIMLRKLLRPLWRLALDSGLRLSMAALRNPIQHAPAVATALQRLRLPPFPGFAKRLDQWATARAALRAEAQNATRFDRSEDAPPSHPAQQKCRSPLVQWSAYPTCHRRGGCLAEPHGESCCARRAAWRRAMILPDALMLDFGVGWNLEDLRPGGALHAWFGLVGHNLRCNEAVITFSRHVGQRHVVERLGGDPAKVCIIPHAPPDLLPLLDFVPPTRRRSVGSRAMAADLLRRHAAERGWRYLADFPLEHVPSSPFPPKNVQVRTCRP